MSNIKMALSPIIIEYTKPAIEYDFIIINLKVWTGNINQSGVTYLFDNDLPIVKKNRTQNTTVSCNIGNYIAPFLNPLPNESFFTGVSPYFNEFVNFSYIISDYKYIFDSFTSVRDSRFISDVLQASLGYQENDEISNNITINKLNSLNSHPLTVYNANLNPSPTSTSNIVIRSSTLQYKYIRKGITEAKQILFLNKNGLIDSFTFPRYCKTTLKTSMTTFSSSNKSEIVSKNGFLNYEVNTDLLDEYNVGLLLELILSDRHWLVDYDNFSFEPIILQNDDFELKTALNHRAKMQYTIKFVTANNFIQNNK